MEGLTIQITMDDPRGGDGIALLIDNMSWDRETLSGSSDARRLMVGTPGPLEAGSPATWQLRCASRLQVSSPVAPALPKGGGSTSFLMARQESLSACRGGSAPGGGPSCKSGGKRELRRPSYRTQS
eukprot:jgi/Tetstr1/459993/TSEL_005317.t1